ncbi:MAG: GNAT family N-acetyltransferase [Gaiellaceae bacterium]
MKLVTEDFAVPAGLEHERFRLRMLTIDDVVKDFDAICDRVNAAGQRQPPFVETVRENLVDLGWHQKEFELRRSFAYTVVAPDESQVLGCVYVDHSDTHDARVWLWVRRSAWEDGLDPLLESAVRDWIARDWPFASVDWASRA